MSDKRLIAASEYILEQVLEQKCPYDFCLSYNVTSSLEMKVVWAKETTKYIYNEAKKTNQAIESVYFDMTVQILVDGSCKEAFRTLVSYRADVILNVLKWGSEILCQDISPTSKKPKPQLSSATSNVGILETSFPSRTASLPITNTTGALRRDFRLNATMNLNTLSPTSSPIAINSTNEALRRDVWLNATMHYTTLSPTSSPIVDSNASANATEVARDVWESSTNTSTSGLVYYWNQSDRCILSPELMVSLSGTNNTEEEYIIALVEGIISALKNNSTSVEVEQACLFMEEKFIQVHFTRRGCFVLLHIRKSYSGVALFS